MKKIIFCKYNQSRADIFQIKTIIYEEDGKKFVEKIPLSSSAEKHINSFVKNYTKIKNQYTNIEYLPVEQQSNSIKYPYLKGKTVDEYLAAYINYEEELFQKIKYIISNMYDVADKNFCKFELSDEYKEWFGDIDCSDDQCISPLNLDLIFSNVMYTEQEKYYAFDYEWVCHFPLPKDFAIFRALHHFYIQYNAILSKKYSLDEFFDKCGMNIEKCHRYQLMEENMYKKICTGGEVAFQESKYQVKRTTFDEILYDKKLLKETTELLNQTTELLNQTTDVLHQTEQQYLNAMGEWGNKEQQYTSEINRMKSKEQQYLNSINESKEMEQKYLAEINMLQQSIHLMENSSSWRITKPIRLVKRAQMCVKEHGIHYTLQYGSKKVTHKLGKSQIEGIHNTISNIFPTESHIVSEDELKYQSEQRFTYEPKISIITPLFNTPINYLTELLASLIKQTYYNWELCLLDCSDSEHEEVGKICNEYCAMEARIVYKKEENKGISENTNRCITLSTGEYIGLLDHDDILHPSALYEVVKVINEQESDFIYSDEIKFSDDVRQSYAPNFKPDFAKDELRAHNYICHFNVYKRSLYDQTEGYRKEFDGSQDHDIVLRLTEKAERIAHIPKILYYWRVHQNSVAMCIDAKSYATDAGVNAVNEQLQRAGEEKYVKSVMNNIPVYRLYSKQRNEEKITIIVWDAKKAGQVTECVQSILKSEKHDVKFVVIEGIGAEKDLHEQCQKELPEVSFDYIKRNDKMESELWNEAMEQSVEQYGLFVNANLKICSENMLQEILLYSTRKDMAVVDAKILQGNKVCSGGIALSHSNDGKTKLKFRGKGLDKNMEGYEAFLRNVRNVFTVTGCCTCFSKAVWEKIGKFSNDSFPWIEYGIEAVKQGYWNVWTPFVIAEGDISKQMEQMEQISFENKNLIDPYYNINLEKYNLD